MGKDKGAWSDAFQSACEEPTSLAFPELVKNCVLQQPDLINFPFAASSDDVSWASKGCFLSVVLGCGILQGFGSSQLVQRGCDRVCGAAASLASGSWCWRLWQSPSRTFLSARLWGRCPKHGPSPNSLLLQKHRQERIFIDREAALYSPHPISRFLLIFILHIGD